ncbi:hypothetical protein M422DRAFT_249935 [Sphaerobolus stellatus SS14]|nr:hypothetical protein M422DRAFT_249935 [Sphaerobolus stellatus SS14]
MFATLDMDEVHKDPATRRAVAALSTSVAKSKRIIIVTGAGISCSSGIPDFRSSDGLYALVKAKYPNVVMKGRDLFDSIVFRDTESTALFYTFMAGLKSAIDHATPSPTHHFIKTLDTKGRLLRSYTQNIDGLEERAGLVGSSSESAKTNGKGKNKLKRKEVRNVQLHGDIHSVRCVLCSAELQCTSEHIEAFSEGVPPNCPQCQTRCDERVARAARAVKIGTLRPAIVLYDEHHPFGEDIGAIRAADLGRKPDMLIVMGTSLKVHGLRALVKEFASVVHDQKTGTGKVIFVNKTPPASEWSSIFDFHVAGDTDAWSSRVLEDWKKIRPQDWEIQTTLVQSGDERSPFKVVKQAKVTTQPKAKGGKKKTNDTQDENAPPTKTIRPQSIPAAATLPTPPLSPSKRKSQAENYDGIECSPSKRRTKVLGQNTLPERGLLFGTIPSQTLKPEVVILKEKVMKPTRRKAAAKNIIPMYEDKENLVVQDPFLVEA